MYCKFLKLYCTEPSWLDWFCTGELQVRYEFLYCGSVVCIFFAVFLVLYFLMGSLCVRVGVYDIINKSHVIVILVSPHGSIGDSVLVNMIVHTISQSFIRYMRDCDTRPGMMFVCN